MKKDYIVSDNPELAILEEIKNQTSIEEVPKEGKLLFNESSWQRFGPKSIYRWKGHQTMIKGKVFSWGTFMNMKDQENKITVKCWQGGGENLHPKDWVKINKTITKKTEVDKKDFFKGVMDTLSDFSRHEYLDRKNIGIVSGLKKNEFNDLCVPMYDPNNIEDVIGIQKIPAKGSKKLNYPGSKLGIFLVGEPTKRIFLCEGIADAITIHEFTNCQTICCFGLFNMDKMAKKFATENEHVQYIVCADMVSLEDITKSKTVDTLDEYKVMYSNKFDKFMNILVIFPEVKDIEPGVMVKDFNDLYQMDKNEAAKQLTNLGKVPYIKLLGYKANKIYIYSSINKDTHVLSESSKAAIYLVAGMDFWKRKFPGVEQERTILKKLFVASREIIFEEWKVRQAGVWNDGGNVVINTGSYLIGRASKNYTYIFTGNFPDPTGVEYSNEYWNILREDAFPHFAFENKWEVYILFFSIILSSISRILPFRFSVNLESESSTGKTYIADDIIEPMTSELGKTFVKITKEDTMAAALELMSSHSLVYFEENEVDKEGKAYADMFSEIIRTISTKPSLVRKKASMRKNDFTTQEVGCCIFKAFNMRGDMIAADINRSLFLCLRKELVYKRDFFKAKKVMTPEALADFGKGLVCTLLNQWPEFMIYYNGCIKDGISRGWSSFHKFKIYMQFVALAKTLKLLDDKELKEFEAYIKKTQTNDREDVDREQEIILNSILHFNFWLDKDKFSIYEMIMDFCRKEQVYESAERLLKYKHMILKSEVYIGISNGEICLKIPNVSTFLMDNFYKTNKRFTQNYSKILSYKYYSIRLTSPVTGIRKPGIAIPLRNVLNKSSLLEHLTHNVEEANAGIKKLSGESGTESKESSKPS